MSERIFIGNNEGKNLKCKIEEGSDLRCEKESKAPSTSKSEVEDLLIMRPDICTKSAIKSFEIGEHSGSTKNPTVELLSQNATDEPLPQNNVNEPLLELEVRELACQYCDKKFSTSQALRGHQNAHRRERLFQRMEEQRRKLERLNSTLRITSDNQPYRCPFSTPINYQGYSYLRRVNLHLQTLPLLPRTNPIGEGLIDANSNEPSSSTPEELNLNLTL